MPTAARSPIRTTSTRQPREWFFVSRAESKQLRKFVPPPPPPKKKRCEKVAAAEFFKILNWKISFAWQDENCVKRRESARADVKGKYNKYASSVKVMEIFFKILAEEFQNPDGGSFEKN